MASWFYGFNRGANPLLGSSISVATATNAGKDFELRVNTLDANGKAPTRRDVVEFLCVLEKYILSNGQDGADPSSAHGGTDLPPL